jgi:hypothetical protein
MAAQILSDEHRQDLPGEELGQTGVVDPRDRVEDAVLIHPTLGHQKVEVRVKIYPVSEGLDGGEDTRDELFPRHGLEIIRQGVDRRAAKIAQEPPLVLEKRPQHLGDGEDDLAVRDVQEERLPDPLSPFLDPLGVARRAESPGAAGEHDQPLLPAIGTPKTGKSAPRVAAIEIALDHLLDDRPKISVLPLESTLVFGQKALEMMGDHPIENGALRMPRTIDSRHGGRNVPRFGPRSTGKPDLLWKYTLSPSPDAEIKSKNVNRS